VRRLRGKLTFAEPGSEDETGVASIIYGTNKPQLPFDEDVLTIPHAFAVTEPLPGRPFVPKPFSIEVAAPRDGNKGLWQISLPVTSRTSTYDAPTRRTNAAGLPVGFLVESNSATDINFSARDAKDKSRAVWVSCAWARYVSQPSPTRSTMYCFALPSPAEAKAIEVEKAERGK
jgi:hypothetical protein